MTNKKNCFGILILILLLVFGMTAVGCDFDAPPPPRAEVRKAKGPLMEPIQAAAIH